MTQVHTTLSDKIPPASDSLPKVTTLNDYNGFFTNHVKSLITKKKQCGTPFKCKEVIVSAGPFREWTVRYEVWGENNDKLIVDFYSVTRPGAFYSGSDSYNMADNEIINLL